MEIYRQIEQFCVEQKLLKRQDEVILSFSGGPDSMLLYQFLSQYLSIPVHLVYFNHQLRSKEALKEEKSLIETVFSSHKGPSRLMELNVSDYASQHQLSTETAGRLLRHAALESYAEMTGCQKVALGHHMDDLVESFFMQLIRGAGSGLMGVKPKVSFLEGVSLIRPLLCLTKKQILSALDISNQAYSVDETNVETHYRRNYLRQEILPEIEAINPSYRQAILGFLAIQEDRKAFEDRAIEPALAVARFSDSRDAVRIARAVVSALDPFLQQSLMYHLSKEVVGHNAGIRRVQIETIVKALSSGEKKQVDLPKNYLCVLSKEMIEISPKEFKT